jgi:hypothetical protein
MNRLIFTSRLPIPWASYQCTSALHRRPSSRRNVATPLIFLQRPVPYTRRSRGSSRIDRPTAITSMFAMVPITSKSMPRLSHLRRPASTPRRPTSSIWPLCSTATGSVAETSIETPFQSTRSRGLLARATARLSSRTTAVTRRRPRTIAFKIRPIRHWGSLLRYRGSWAAVVCRRCAAGRPSPSRLSVILPRRRGGGKHFFRVPRSGSPIRASHRRDDSVSRQEPHVLFVCVASALKGPDISAQGKATRVVRASPSPWVAYHCDE